MADKYLGCLIGAAAGDALGAPTETRNPNQIRTYFKGPVITFLTPPSDVFARGNLAGQVTDDFCLAYVTLQTILEHQIVSTEVSIKGLLTWAANPDYVRLAGPTTLATINRLRSKDSIQSTEFIVASDNAKATNGLAMKTAPLALLSHGDIEKAISNIFTIGQVTHNNTIALSAGAAVAAATAKALQPSATLQIVLDAAIKGAHVGQEKALLMGADDLAGSNVARRIEHAIYIAQKSQSKEEGQQDLIDFIGTGILAYESIPTAFGLLALYPDEPIEALYAAVNIGNDTDTIATIVGGIIGALYGDQIFPDTFLSILNEVNGYNLESLALKVKAWHY